MIGKIKINCRKVYDTGVSYNKASDSIKESQSNLTTLAGEIASIWKGADGNNFQASFNEHIKSLDTIVDFLEDKSAILKGDALDHNTTDNNFVAKMKRSDLDE